MSISKPSEINSQATFEPMPEQLFTQCATFRINGGCKRSAHLWLNHLKQTELSEQSHIPNIALPPASSQKMEEYWMRLALVICDDGAALGIKVPLIIQVIEAERRRLTVCQNRAQQWCFTRRNKVTAAFQVFVYRAACNALQLATDILRSGIHPSADYFMSSAARFERCHFDRAPITIRIHNHNQL